MTADDGNSRVTDRLPKKKNGPPDDARVTDRLPRKKNQPFEASRITDRLPRKKNESSGEGRVTDRLPADRRSDRVTERLVRSREPSGSKPGSPRDIIDGRFQIEAGPLGKETGEAQVYKCRDLAAGETAAVKLYKPHIKPKEDVLASLVNLDHPGLVGLRSYGWWRGRFYEVQEFCQGGDMTEIAPLSEERLNGYLGQIVQGLKFCHDQGVIHRDIKPQNLLFRDRERTQVAIGDFGISSVLPEGKSEQVTQTFMFFTLDYAAPEQLRLRKVGPAADFYSLGITVLFLLFGRSPFEGLVYHEIVDVHLRGAVPRPPGLSEWLELLLEGLLRRSPETRWGYEKVMAWLSGEPIIEEAHFDREIPYPHLPDVRNPVQMARHLDEFDAAAELFRGRISLWVELFDPILAAKVSQIEENFSEQPELGVFKLKYTLDPNLPLTVHEAEFYDLAGLAEALESADRHIELELARLFWGGMMDCWIEASFGGPKALELAETIRSYIVRRKSEEARLGALPLLFLIDPGRSFRLADDVILQKPGDIPKLLKNDPSLKEAIQFNLYSGRFEAWLELCFSDADKDIAFFRYCREQLANDRLLGLQALVWRYSPGAAFKFAGQLVREPRSLAALIDAGEETKQAAKGVVKSGRLRTWLFSSGMLKDPEAFDRLARSEALNEDAALESILHILDPDLPNPEIRVDSVEIYLGLVRAGEKESAEFMVENVGRGHMWGRIMVEGAGAELIVAPARVEGRLTKINVTAEPPWWMKQQTTRKAKIIIETNGGRAEVDVEYQVVPYDFEPKSEGLWDRLSSLWKPRQD